MKPWLNLLIYVRILGKKQFGELTFFNYVTGVSLGNIAGDMKIQTNARKYIPTEIIVYGVVLERNLDNAWSGNQLAKSKVSTVSEIFYAQLQEDGSLYIIKK